MKKNLLLHGAWIIAAILSFNIGAKFFPAGGNDDKERMATGARKGSADERGSLAVGKGGSSKASAKRSGGDGVDSGSLEVVKRKLTDGDIESLGEQLRKGTNPIERRFAFTALLAGLTAENALQVRKQIEHMDHRSAEFREFHYAWGAVGGADAVMFGADTEEDDMSPALTGWASADPEAALAWFNNLDMENNAGFDALLKDRKIPAAALTGHLMRGLVQGLADANPDTASRFVQDMVASGHEGAEGMIHIVAGAVMRSDSPADAALWSEGLPEGKMRDMAMHRMAGHFARSDPEAAASWAGNFSSQPESAGVIAEVGQNWAARDAQAAVDWLGSLPAGNGQNAGMHRALGQWAQRDPTAASEHLSSMAASDAKDAAVSGFSRRLAWENPQAAMSWAESIGSDDQRTESIISVGRAWSKRDASGAAEWMVSSGVSEDVQQAILNPPKDEGAARGRRR
ncbi:MAG: hypothetical protein GY899_11880 [Verrucomicrobiaceae bacterium]|nr:hypothetical protein [Verrucomicrobiaceae bacterium]